MLTKVEGWVLKRKKYVREFGPTSQGIWSPKTLNLVRLLLGRIPLLKVLGSAARSIFLAKKGPPGDQIPQHIYIYISLCNPSLFFYLSESLSLYIYIYIYGGLFGCDPPFGSKSHFSQVL